MTEVANAIVLSLLILAGAAMTILAVAVAIIRNKEYRDETDQENWHTCEGCANGEKTWLGSGYLCIRCKVDGEYYSRYGWCEKWEDML